MSRRGIGKSRRLPEYRPESRFVDIAEPAEEPNTLVSLAGAERHQALTARERAHIETFWSARQEIGGGVKWRLVCPCGNSQGVPTLEYHAGVLALVFPAQRKRDAASGSWVKPAPMVWLDDDLPRPCLDPACIEKHGDHSKRAVELFQCKCRRHFVFTDKPDDWRGYLTHKWDESEPSPFGVGDHIRVFDLSAPLRFEQIDVSRFSVAALGFGNASRVVE